MGENEGWEEQGGSMLNGFLPGAGPVMQAVDTELWLKAEERTAELIACIQPNQLSEERRNAVADYVQRLIENCLPCHKVFTFGSVPLKTYLPDGDIDLTAFSQNLNQNQNLKETWANYVRDMLENEEKNENAEFHVKEVQYIQAEVKIIKCLVENIVVDISFNQVGGLCTLCFLDEVDAMIKQNYLFKRSIILIKAWCYYESRILGAHHGLISTYALETLVLYIFHVFSNPFHGPLEVLYRFLEFFSNFDWDNFCVSLWGPVPISALPYGTAEPPRKDGRELLLSKRFLDACSSEYAVFPEGHENNRQPFVSKHFNVIDPLRVNNNLGRSVSKGNFFRIRSAFAFGAKKLARLLSCPKENVVSEVNQFFMNTLERHGTGHRPDAPGIDSRSLRLSTPDSPQKFNISNNNMNRKKQNESSSVKHLNSTSFDVTDKIRNQVVLKDEVQRDMKVGQLVNDTNVRNLFARTRSSPELTDTYGDVYSKVPLTKEESANAPPCLDNSNRIMNLGSENLASHSRRSSVEDASSMRNIPSKQSLDGYQQELGLDEDFQSARTHIMNQEEQDNVNMAAISSLQGFNGQFHLPFNLTSGPQPFPVPPSFFASMGYNTQRNFPGFAPNNFPFIDPSFQNMHFPQGLVSPELTHCFPNFRLNTPCDDSVEQTNENFGHVEMNSVEPDSDCWQEQDVGSSGGYEPENEHFDLCLRDDKPTKSLPGLKYVPPFRVNASARVQQKSSREKRDNVDSFSIQDTRSDEVYAEERSTSSRLSSATHNNSLRSRTPSSESSWDGSVKTPKSTKEKRGKKLASKDLPAGHGKAKILSGHLSNQADDDDQDWSSLLNHGPESISSLQVATPHIEVSRMNGSDSMTPFAPMLIRPGSWQRGGDNSGMIPFYPTGPPIPFLIYNVTADTGSFVASTPRFGVTSDTTEPEQNFSPRGFDQLDHLNSPSSFKGTAAIETSEEQNSHILNSDFDSHLRNLKIGRFCQNPQPLFYPSPVMVPPVYLQGRFPYPYDNTGRPLSTNANILPQLMTSNGQHLVPGSPVQPVADRPSNMFQRYMDVSPRYRSGTGTYLPNPRLSAKERQSSGTRRGNYNNDRNDNYGDRDGNWNGNSKSRGGSRNHTRGQTDKSNLRSDRLASNDTRSWNSNRNDSIPLHQSQNNVQLQTSTNGPSVPPVTMFYPFDHQSAATNDSHDEQLEFGSLDPVGFPGTNEQSQLNEGTRARAFEEHRLHGSSGQRSSPDQPSSPHRQREYSQRNRR